MLPLLTANFAAGVVATPHCVGMCGPFACHGRGAWHVGKLTTYAALGAVAGAAGALLPGPAWFGSAVGVVLLAVSALRLAGVVEPPKLGGATLVRWGRSLAGRQDLVGRALLGALAGLLPCGMVHAALALSILGRDPAFGALAMVAFGLGTVPGLLVSQRLLGWVARRRPAARKLVAAAVFVAGLGAIALRAPLGAPEGSEPVCHPSLSEVSP